MNVVGLFSLYKIIEYTLINNIIRIHTNNHVMYSKRYVVSLVKVETV